MRQQDLSRKEEDVMIRKQLSSLQQSTVRLKQEKHHDSPTFMFATITVSSSGSLTKLADVRMVVHPFHSINKPVHTKDLVSPT
jgi:hypothetical protein